METLVLALMLGAIALIIIAYGTYHNRKNRKYAIEKIKGSYGSECMRTYADGEYAHIPGYYNVHKPDDNDAVYHVDDITWHDLNMDEIYRSLDRCQSSAGDEYLYHVLRCPATDEEGLKRLRRTDELAGYYDKNPDKRLDMSVALYDMGRTGKYSIYDYINNLDALGESSAKSDIILLALYGVAIVSLFFNVYFGGLFLFGLLMYGGITYFAKKRKIEPYIISFAYVMKLTDGARHIMSYKDDIIAPECERLKTAVSNMSAFGRFAGITMSGSSGGDLMELLLDYIKIFTHIDIIKFYNMRGEIIKHSEDIDEMLTVIGTLDLSIAVASYRAYLGRYCIPEFITDKGASGGVLYEAKELYHPLLSDPVANDVSLKRGILLTGSNASGKSTMLRTITLAAILAQSVYTVPADTYRAGMFRVYTSLALSDDIIAGESYYMTEIKSLKRIIDQSKNKEIPVLAAIDEVLRGTNTVERISASTAIMKQLSGCGGLILAATHDLELADILKDCYDNHHFEETIKDDDISFEYKLLPGKATTRNAIRLLRITGYDDELVDEAEAMAKQFFT